MKKINNLQILFLTLFSIFGIEALQAQSYIEITAPAELAGRKIEYLPTTWTGGYEAWEQKVGTSSPGSFTEPERIACSDVTNDLTGTVAFIRRGTCSFGSKAYRAQVANAKAVLIIQNAANTAPIAMAEDTLYDVTIPTGMIRKEIGDTIMALMESGVTVEARAIYVCDPAPYDLPFNVLWGLDGEAGTFKGGMNGWSSISVQCSGAPSESAEWYWAKNGLTKGGFWGGNVINSRTACDGAMVFDSDYLDNGGSSASGSGGTGPCPAVNAAYLQSPEIPVPPGLAAVNLLFFQRVTQFRSTFYIGYSTDGGLTWDSIQINQEVKPFTNLDPNPDNIVNAYKSVRLPNVQDASSVIVRFMIYGNYYHWAIDDVMLIQPEDYNISLPLSSNWFGGPTMAQNQKEQKTTNVWMTDVENAGGKTATNVTLTVNVRDTTTKALIYTYTHDIGDIAPGDTVQNIVSNGLTFVTPNAPGVYEIEYHIAMDSSDYNDDDNTKKILWMITDSTWAYDIAFTNAYSLNQGFLDRFSGAIFRMENDAKNKTFDHVEFGLFPGGSELQGLGVEARVYEFEDTNGDQQVNSTEMTGGSYIALGDIELGAQSAETYNVRLYDLEGRPTQVTMKPGKSYMVGVHFLNEISQSHLFHMVDENYNYLASEYAQSTLDEAKYYRPVSIFQRTDNTTDFNISRGRSVLFGNYSRLFTSDRLATSNKQQALADDAVSVFPTIADNNINVEFNFVNAADANIQIMDVNGKVVYTTKVANALDQTQNILFGDIKAGNYLVKVTTQEGVSTKQFTVAK